MSNSSSTSLNGTENTLAINNIPVPVRFWTYLISDVLSIACSLFVLYYLFFDRALRRALNNHVIIVLLFIGLVNEITSVPWILYRQRFGIALIQTPDFYLSSYFFDYATFTTQIILFAWATLERHILIYHDHWISTKQRRFFVHYLPIISILIYTLVYYSVTTFGPFCKNSFVSFLAGGYIIPCVYGNKVLAMWELLAHQVIPTLIIVIFSISLIIRALQQKQRVNQRIQWRKYRKMTIQLLSISALYLAFNSPWVFILFASQYGLPPNITRIYTFYGLYFRNYVIFLFPFVCFGSLSELRDEFKKKFLWCRRQHRGITEMTIESNT
ncbi:unnamed protein product [Adineta steineri]|uniref:G-protein coupled receptors family 1 profile domain-containing protein n=1 Tax=Adineta steineri TaxID=433720 RepID=A0A815LEI1_9BILA|nr:unnamed protein product [Adineta steineri]CAF4184730.1 unnamed protein product [Adineta steineri]